VGLDKQGDCDADLTPRERFIMALEGRQPPGRVPHFELVFYLTMEAFGRVHPCQRHYAQWNQMSDNERRLHRQDIADLYVAVARGYEHSAIFFHPPGGWGADTDAETMRTLEIIRSNSPMDYFLMVHGDATYAIPDGAGMMKFAEDIAERPGRLKDDAQRMVDEALSRAQQFHRHGVLDGFALCSDYCFNSGPFLSPAMFEEFIAPYLTRLVAGYREMGFYVIKHTDGNIMPILDSLVAAKPHALHSLDPQAGVDIAEVKRLVGDKVCLIGNVNCGALQTGSEQDVIASARYALRSGMPGGGYVFSTSNCIYTGLPLERYELMLGVWRKEGNYK
jgi:uroporphyrinogen decarboxylase